MAELTQRPCQSTVRGRPTFTETTTARSLVTSTSIHRGLSTDGQRNGPGGSSSPTRSGLARGDGLPGVSGQRKHRRAETPHERRIARGEFSEGALLGGL